jgi:hypothetical protein
MPPEWELVREWLPEEENFACHWLCQCREIVRF